MKNSNEKSKECCKECRNGNCPINIDGKRVCPCYKPSVEVMENLETLKCKYCNWISTSAWNSCPQCNKPFEPHSQKLVSELKEKAIYQNGVDIVVKEK